MAYDSPNSSVRREWYGATAAGSGTVGVKFRTFQAAKLMAVHAIVLVAGTSTSPGHALTIKHGTTSIGLLAMGTATAGSVVSNVAVDETLAAFDQVSVTNGTDVTGTAEVIYEYQVSPDAALSA